MKHTPKSLRTSCVITLARNYTYINFTVLPEELSKEIILAIRDPKYGEQKKTVCFFDSNSTYRTDIVEYLYHHDPHNTILRYYGRDSQQYNYLLESRRSNISHIGVIYDISRDIFIVVDYTHFSHLMGVCYIVEDLPSPLLKQLETKYKIEMLDVPVASITPIIRHR